MLGSASAAVELHQFPVTSSELQHVRDMNRAELNGIVKRGTEGNSSSGSIIMNVQNDMVEQVTANG